MLIGDGFLGIVQRNRLMNLLPHKAVRYGCHKFSWSVLRSFFSTFVSCLINTWTRAMAFLSENFFFFAYRTNAQVSGFRVADSIPPGETWSWMAFVLKIYGAFFRVRNDQSGLV